MIYDEFFFKEISGQLGLVCPDESDTSDLADIAQLAASGEASAISVSPESVHVLWDWLEKHPVKIFSRFVFYVSKQREKNETENISKLACDITLSLKKGASGAHIFIPYEKLEYFTQNISPIRNDLFFNKDLCIGLDINEINDKDWQNVFDAINSIKANALILYLSENKKNNSDFVGRVYALMNCFVDFDGQLHFYLDKDHEKIEQVLRLAQKIKPDIINRLKFFINR